jgi:hypothetical protein
MLTIRQEQGFCLELETARTFLQTAATSQVEETRVRNRKNAQLAYETVLKYAPDVTLVGEQKWRFETLLAELRKLLLAAELPS